MSYPVVKGTFSVERLVHFQCGYCHRWWSVSGGDETKQWSCPFCRGRQSFVEATSVIEFASTAKEVSVSA